MKSVKLRLLIFCDLILLLYAFHYWVGMNKFVLSLSINLMIFVVPGLAWVGVFRKRPGDLFSMLLYVVFLSILILILGNAGHLLLGIGISSASQLIYLVVVTNVGILFSRPIGWVTPSFVKDSKSPALWLAPLLLLYGCLYYGAASIVPGLEDHDVVTQSTAYGITRTLKPLTLTDRLGVYDFDRPSLSRFYHAQAFLFSDRLDDVKHYYDTALTARDIEGTELREGMRIPLAKAAEDWEINVPDYQIVRVDSGKVTLDRELPKEGVTVDVATIKDRWMRGLVVRQYQRFFADPQLLETRMPNLFFSVVTGAVLFFILLYLTGSQLLSLFGVILYFSFPEIFVRSCYGGYMPITNFSLAVMFCLYLVYSQGRGEQTDVNVALFLTGIFAALSNHKAVILPLAIGAAILFGHDTVKRRLRYCLTNRAVVGFAAGTALFWIYGLAINARAFITDHLGTHILHRLLHYNVFGYTGYPSAGGLWREFNHSLGIPFLIMAVAIIACSLKYLRREEKGSSVWTFWFLIGAVLFSVVDWRQTKHLMLIVLPLVIAMITFISKQNRIARSGLVIVLVYVVLRNLHMILRLANDFSVIEPSAGW